MPKINKKAKTEIYYFTNKGLLLTGVVENNQKKSALSLGIKLLYCKSGGKPCPGTPSIIYGGKKYHTVQIGNQCWLKENLDLGTMIKVTRIKKITE